MSYQKSLNRQKLHDEQFSAIKALVKRLEKIGGIERNSQYDEEILAMTAILSLAARKIMPVPLKEKPAAAILSGLVSDCRLDETQFSRRLTRLADSKCLTANSEVMSCLKKILSEPGSQEILGDPLIVGWVHQSLLSEKRGCFTPTGVPQDFQKLSGKDIQSEHLPLLTQFFTPNWIGKFLVSETFDCLGDIEDITLIDPCLGAGHIFVEALIERLERLPNLSPEEALTKILSEELFGCDLDKKVVEIAAFSIYLACRDRAPICELPLPQIYYFGDGFGSLCLSVEDRQNVKLFGLNGQVDLSKLDRSYMAVVTNPPYLSHRLMPKELSSFLKRNYSVGRFDLYAAFLKLSMNLLEDGGVFALICQQSFMSISRYEELRQELLRDFNIKILVQLGSGVFASRRGEKVNNAIVVAQFKPEQSVADKTAQKVEGFRILSDEDKITAQRQGIRKLAKFDINKDCFEKFPGKQFAFWCPPEVLQLFELPALESPASGIKTVNGLFTCNNKEFVKFYWQLEDNESCHYVPYDKGGGQKWYYTTPLRLNWQDKGNVIRAYRKGKGQSAALPGERYYFQQGVTYSYIGTRGFRARLLSPGSIFDIASSALFADDPIYLLGFLNSSLTRFLLGLLNPTINFQIGDLRRLPYKEPGEQTRKNVSNAVNDAIELARQRETFDKQSPNYLGPALLRYKGAIDSDEQLAEACVRHREELTRLNQLEAKLQKTIDDEIFEHYGIGENTRRLIESDPWVCRNEKFIAQLPTDKQLLAELADSKTAF